MPESVRRPALQPLTAWIGGQRRLLSGLLLSGMLGLTALGGMHWLSDPYRFPLDVVEVKGEFRYLQKQQLQAAVAPHVTGGFFTVDVDSVRVAAEALPWVDSARVRRVWPTTLRLRITEQQPVAHWNDNGYLNAAGVPFFPRAGASPSGLPRLAGPDGQARKVLQRFHEVAGVAQPLGLQVSGLLMDGRRAWTVRFDNGVQLKLGRARPWERLQRFARAWPEVFAGRVTDLQSVDMRYSNGFSVRWQQPEAAEVVAQRDT